MKYLFYLIYKCNCFFFFFDKYLIDTTSFTTTHNVKFMQFLHILTVVCYFLCFFMFFVNFVTFVKCVQCGTIPRRNKYFNLISKVRHIRSISYQLNRQCCDKCANTLAIRHKSRTFFT